MDKVSDNALEMAIKTYECHTSIHGKEMVSLLKELQYKRGLETTGWKRWDGEKWEDVPPASWNPPIPTLSSSVKIGKA